MSLFKPDIFKNINKNRNIVGSIAPDINSMYNNLPARAAAAESALRATTLGRSGQIKIIAEGDQVRYYLPATNSTVSSIEEAINEVSGLSLSEVKVFGKKLPFREVNNGFLNQYSATAGIYEDIYDKLQNLSPYQIKQLQEAGVDVSKLNEFQMGVFTFNTESKKELVNRIKDARKKGQMKGLITLDDEGGRLLNLKIGAEELDQHQSALLLAITGHDKHSRQQLLDALQHTDPAKVNQKLLSVFEKYGKRERAYLSARDISLSETELGNMIEKFAGKAKSLEDVTLILDPQYEILKRYADRNFQFGGDTALLKYYKGFNAKTHVEQILGTFEHGMSPTELSAFEKELKMGIRGFSIDKSKNTFYSDQLREHLDSIFAGREPQQKAVSGIFKTIEQSYDGADLINKKFIKTYKDELSGEMTRLESLIKDPLTDATERQHFISQRASLESKIERINAGDLSQVTLRGNIKVGQLSSQTNEVFKNMKSAVNQARFQGELDDYALIMTRFSLKGDSGLAGSTRSLIMSGIGEHGENVYADPVAGAFHGEIFSSPEALEAMELRSRRVLAEYQETLKTGVLPSNIKKMLERQASTDIDTMPAAMRLSGQRNKDMARELLELHQTSSITDSPYLMSMLHKRFATEAFREKKGFLQPVMPDTMRFAVASEMSGVGTTGGNSKRFFGRGKYGFDTVEEMNGIKVNQDILKFRIEGHRMILPHFAPTQYHHSLGGFDLDDKSIVRLATYEDAKQKRLGFYALRQPSGPEEVIFMRNQLDKKSIQSLFGENDLFKEALSEIKARGNNIDTFERLENILENKPKVTVSNKDKMEAAIVEVLEHMESKKHVKLQRLSSEAVDRLAKYGSSSLRWTDVGIHPKYSREGIHKLMLEDESVFDISKDVLGVIHEKYQHLSPLVEGKNIKEIGDILQQNVSKENISAIFTTAEQRLEERAAQDATGFLGQYVNRSMAIGSSMNQYADYYNAADDVVKKYISDNKILYSSGILSQETAIDLSVNLTTGKRLHADTLDLLEQYKGSVDTSKLGESLSKLFQTGAGDLDTIGQAGIESLGRFAGLSRAVGSANKDLTMGIDSFILKNKMAAGDKQIYLENVIRGMQDVTGNDALLRHANSMGQSLDDINKTIEEYSKAVGQGNESINKILERDFSLSASHKYSTLAKIHQIGQDMQTQLEVLRRNHIAQIGSDPILRMAETSAGERAIADRIVANHAQNIYDLYKSEFDPKELDNLTRYSLDARKRKLAENMLEDFHAAAQIKGNTKYGIVNAADQLLMPSGIDMRKMTPLTLESGEPLSAKAQEMYKAFEDVQKIRKVKHYENYDYDSVDQAISMIRGKMDPSLAQKELHKIQEEALDHAKQALEGRENDFDEATNMLRALTGRTNEIQDQALAKKATMDAHAYRARLDKSTLIEEGVLDQNGNAPGLIEEGIIERLGTDPDLEGRLTDDMIQASVHGEEFIENSYKVTSPIFKRFSEKLGEESFQKLIKSPTVKNTATAAAAVIAGSFIYSALKNRSHSDMKGPPLLPGGSPYEDDLPRAIPEIDSQSGQQYSPGVNYQVHIYGDNDKIHKFNKAAGGLVKGNMNTTMYNRIPELGKSPYNSFMSSF